MSDIGKIIKEMIVMIVATAVIAFIFSALEFVGLMAAELPLRMEDEDGCIVTTVDDYYVTDRAVTFVIDNELVPDGRVVAYSSRRDSEPESALLPIEGGRLRVEPDIGHGYSFRFYLYSEDDGDCTGLQGEGQFYGVYFEEDNSPPDASFEARIVESDGEKYYVAGEAPVLAVKPTGTAEAFVEVNYVSEGRSEVYPLNGPLRMTFGEGEYEVDVYEVSGSAKKLESEGFPLQFIYDCTPPEGVEFEVDSRDCGLYDGERPDYQLFSADNVQVHLSSSDEVSGLDGILTDCGGRTVEADKLTLSSGTWELSARAIDRCGNESEVSECDTAIMIENEAPQVFIENIPADTERDAKLSERMIYLSLVLRDSESGLHSASITYNGAIIRQEEYYKEHRMIAERDLRLEIPFEEGEAGCLQVYVRDCAGNETQEEREFSSGDDQAPKIDIDGIANGSIVSGDVGISVRVSDANMSSDGVTVTMRIKDGAGIVSEQKLSGLDAINCEKEGEYNVEVRAVDLAGNEAVKTANFTIDRSAPRILGLSKYDGSTLESFSLRDDIQDMFYDDTFVSYRLYVNGRDYLEDDVVNKAGDYTLQVYAVDSAGNMSQDQARFVIAGEKRAEATKASETAGNSIAGLSAKTDEKESPEEKPNREENQSHEEKGFLFVIFPVVILVITVAVWYTLRRRKDGLHK